MSLFRTIVPRPMLSLLLWTVWLLLNNTVAFGHVLLGLILAIGIPRLTYHFWDPQADVKKPLLMVKFIVILVFDIIIANLEVARRILGPSKALRPAFFEYPLAIKGDFPITILASTISLTPGTVSAQLSGDRSRLLVHGLHVDDVPAAIEQIRQRYEAPLQEIFGC
ncbi:MAG: Na+/H+ antiporter subunit E [unclassified Hahellaceae]|nr:Na+/H+ antiporter subunit E [Hahellaceae bacterium]